jgi:N-acetyl-1-D-myo-inositol-2-amino-2-deoxy-alpha-D-glucopyranoside deacetylase
VTGSVVAVVAHPDDESLIAGGTLALAAGAGAATGVVSLTRGERGPISKHTRATRAKLGEVREAELQAAARELGVGWARCLRHPDGELPWVDHDVAADELAALLAPHIPAVVLTFGADGLYWHPDHAAAREIALLAIGRLGEGVELYEAAWPSGLVTRLVAAAAERGLPVGLWGLEPEAFGSDRPATVMIDVRAALPCKLAALRAHRTQVGADHLFAALPDDLAERFLAFEPWVGPENGALEGLIHSD